MDKGKKIFDHLFQKSGYDKLKSEYDDSPDSFNSAIKKWRGLLLIPLRDERGMDEEITVYPLGENEASAHVVRKVSLLIPDDWIAKSEKMGKLFVADPGKRGWHESKNNGDSIISFPLEWDEIALHELMHRIQFAMPELDKIFQEYFLNVTKDEKAESLTKLCPFDGYDKGEVAKKDNFPDPYYGKIYPNGGALELMPMAFQDVLLSYPENFAKLIKNHRDVVYLTLGALYLL